MKPTKFTVKIVTCPQAQPTLNSAHQRNKVNVVTKSSSKINCVKQSKSTVDIDINLLSNDSLNKFKTLLTDLVNKNSHNITFLKEMDNIYKQTLHPMLYHNVEHNSDEEVQHLRNIILKQSTEINNLKSILSNSQKKPNDQPPYDTKSSPKPNGKSKSMFSGFISNKAALKNGSKTVKYEKPNNLAKKMEKIHRNSDTSHINDNTVNIKENLDNSLVSLNSETSVENAKELLYFQSKVVPQQTKSKNSSLPMLSLNIAGKDDAKNSAKQEYISGTTSILTPETNNDAKNIEDKKMEMNCVEDLNLNKHFSFNKTEGNNENIATVKQHNPKSKSFLLNFQNLPKIDYNTEFLAKFDEFSPSWRNECKKVKGLNNELKE